MMENLEPPKYAPYEGGERRLQIDAPIHTQPQRRLEPQSHCAEWPTNPRLRQLNSSASRGPKIGRMVSIKHHGRTILDTNDPI